MREHSCIFSFSVQLIIGSYVNASNRLLKQQHRLHTQLVGSQGYGLGDAVLLSEEFPNIVAIGVHGRDLKQQMQQK